MYFGPEAVVEKKNGKFVVKVKGEVVALADTHNRAARAASAINELLENAYDAGVDDGQQDGYDRYEEGRSDGYDDGYRNGYEQGRQDCEPCHED